MDPKAGGKGWGGEGQRPEPNAFLISALQGFPESENMRQLNHLCAPKSARPHEPSLGHPNFRNLPHTLLPWLSPLISPGGCASLAAVPPPSPPSSGGRPLQSPTARWVCTPRDRALRASPWRRDGRTDAPSPAPNTAPAQRSWENLGTQLRLMPRYLQLPTACAPSSPGSDSSYPGPADKVCSW